MNSMSQARAWQIIAENLQQKSSIRIIIGRQDYYKIGKGKKDQPKKYKQKYEEMSRLIIVIMQEEEYPFGGCENQMLERRKVMVRRRVEFHPFQKKNILLKAKKLKTFVNPHIIRLEQLLEEDSSLHLLFEYVPIKIQTWISNINTQFIETFRLQLFQLADYLAENSILIDFKIKNIGMDQNYRPKYFIGLDYEINTLIGKDLLLEKYKTQITEITNPYRGTNQVQNKQQLTTRLNPEFGSQKSIKNINETLKRQNEKCLNENAVNKNSARCSQTQKAHSSQRDSANKVTNFNEHDLKLTFDGSQKVLFENLPKNISANIKIQHIGRKINDLKKVIQSIGGKAVDKKHDSVSLSPMKGLNIERPNSSYQKLMGKSSPVNNLKVKPEKTNKMSPEVEKIAGKELRQTQSQSDYEHQLPSQRKLDRANEKTNHINEIRTRNEVRVNTNKQSYIYEFERLLNDDLDNFSGIEIQPDLKNQSQEGQENTFAQKKSPRFGFGSGPVEIENIKTEPERFSYSHAVKKRKKSTDSATSNRSEIQDRVNAVIGASRKLINNFRKSKAGEKRQPVGQAAQ